MFKLLYSLSLELWDSVVEMNVLSALLYNYNIMQVLLSTVRLRLRYTLHFIFDCNKIYSHYILYIDDLLHVNFKLLLESIFNS